MYEKGIREKIIKGYAKIRAIEEQQETLLQLLQESCDHESVVEEFRGDFSLRRQCVICLLDEDGPDYKKLPISHFRMESHPGNRYDRLRKLKTTFLPDF